MSNKGNISLSNLKNPISLRQKEQGLNTRQIAKLHEFPEIITQNPIIASKNI